jgi:hypothetical protein
MSNSLSVAMVTAALARILGEALPQVPNGGVDNARVTTLRPDMLAAADGDARGINVFLYEVVGNGAWAAANLPTRRPDGSPVARPQQALDLHYLLTFSGDETTLEPQRMLGVAVGTLAAQPVLSRELVRELIARAQAADPTAWEQFSDLADQVDVVRFTLLPLSLEELSKLWSTFFQAPYRLSVAYHAAVVLLDAEVTPRPALPVLTRGVDAAALTMPEIARVVADADPSDPVGAGTVLRIQGRRLRGAFATRVRLGEVEVTVPDAQATGTQLTVTVPAAAVAGVQGVQVLHPRLVGVPPVERGGAESAAAPVVVRPALAGPVTPVAGAAGTVALRVPLPPAVGRRQRVVLLLNEYHPPDGRPARAYLFVAPPLDPAGPATVDEVRVPVAGVTSGEYLVRVQVDGAESVLAAGADGRFDLPRVAVP